ncbi:MAG: ferredoxin reductase family protein [Actinomycetota bacterium]|nr:ferredoxin reductase family protein [Actinomycetota bacterium]
MSISQLDRPVAAPSRAPLPGAPPAGGVPAGWSPRSVLAGISAGGLLALLLWLSGGAGLTGSAAAFVTALGRLAGLAGGYAVVVLLLLMGRVPALEHGVGADKLARWHARGGRFTVCVLAAHAVLIIWGYALAAHASPVGETATLLRSYPDVAMATVALGLLVGVGVLSARAARARMRYETWYHLHLYTYLAVALGFSHQFANGTDFVANPAARACWAALYAGVAATLAWHRVVVPVRQAFRHRMRVVEVRPEAPGVVSVLVAGESLGELAAQPGQFFRWRFLTRDGWWQSHPFSLSAPPHARMLRITVKTLGDYSSWLQNVRPGTRVMTEGPYGALTAARRRQPRVLLLAGGIGVTPLRTLFETLPGEPGEITLLYRARSAEDLVFRDELTAIATARGARLSFLLGPSGGPRDPLTGAHLAGLVPGLREHDVFVCGPAGMAVAARAALRAAGVPAKSIHTEHFAF